MSGRDFSRLDDLARLVLVDLDTLQDCLQRALDVLEEGDKFDFDYIRTQVDFAREKAQAASSRFGRIWTRVESLINEPDPEGQLPK